MTEHSQHLPARVARHAETRGDHVAIHFDGAPGAPAGILTYAGLLRRMEAAGAALAQAFQPGQRVLLLLPSGLEYVAAVLGCFRTGIIAVPVNLPGPSRVARVLGKIDGIARDATPAGIVTTRAIAEASGETFQTFARTHGLRPIFLDDPAPAPPASWYEPAPGDVAFLQYTSGSTSEPKGVMNTHAALADNFAALERVLRNHPGTVMVNWMPLYHDMGLIGGVLQILHYGNTTVLIPPARFAQTPLCWLEAVSRHRGTVMPGPNFAFDLCLRKIPDDALLDIDLSSMEAVISAAEPLRHATLMAFWERFRARGLRREAMRPCYGLAEATLIVAGTVTDRGLDPLCVDAATLLAGQARTVPADAPGARLLVSSGDDFVGQELRIADPETGRERPEGGVGEIWLRGKSIGSGYWNRPAENAATFQAVLHPCEGAASGGWLRTGDLGFVLDGRFCVTGRLKEAIILRGACHAPTDIEQTARAVDRRLLPQGGACFAVETAQGEKAVLVHEAGRASPAEDAALMEAIRAAIAAEHGFALHAVALIRQGTLLRTTSGKTRRTALRQAWEAGSLALLAERRWPAEETAPDAAPAAARAERPEGVLADRLRRAGTAERRLILLNEIGRILQPLLGRPQHERLPPETGFFELGLDSLAAVEAAAALQARLGLPVAELAAFEHPTLARLADHLLSQLPRNEPAPTLPTAARPRTEAEPIAVIGMGCRFPGGDNGDCRTPDAYLDMLLEGRPARRRETRCGTPREGHLLETIEGFDAAFFRLSPREAASLDPQHRLVLETAWHALEDAGIPPLSLKGSASAVYLGLSPGDYAHLPFAAGQVPDAHYATGNAPAAAAGRLAHLLGLEGEAVVVDTACSSSLSALHLACTSLRAGESDLALVGGAQVLLSGELEAALRGAGMLAADGLCKTFEAEADGYARGEGCGMLVLRRLSDAQAMDSRIHALIAGTSLRQEGARSGLTVPEAGARVAMMRRSLARAGLRPDEIDYVEMHGTGTRLGDPIEFNSLADVYQGARATPLLLGTAKTAIGHLEAGAGVAGAIKAIAALRRGMVPPHPLRRLNPAIVLERIPARLPPAAEPWPVRHDAPRRAAVASFGFSGTIAHALLEQVPEVPAAAEDGPSGPLVLPLSARSPEAFEALRAAWTARIATAPEAELPRLCRGAARMRAHLELRGCAVGEGRSALLADLRDTPFAEHAAQPRIGFLFTGQGAQHAGMAQGLAEASPAFRTALEEVDAALRPWLGHSVREAMRQADDAALRQTGLAQPALFATGYALARMWQAHGLQPALIAGHSVGELAASVIAGHLPLDGVARLVAGRAALMQSLPTGAMLVLRAAEARALALAGGISGIALASVNGPDMIVMSGEAAGIAELTRRAVAEGIGHRALDVSHAFHSPMMEPVLPALRQLGAALRPGREEAVLVSTLTGGAATPAQLADGDYWTAQARQPVRFAAAVAAMAELGCDVLLEIGPRPHLLPLARRAWPEGLKLPLLLPGLDPARPDRTVVAAGLAELHKAGAGLDWNAVNPGPLPQPEDLPLYPFQHRPYWYGFELPKAEPLAALPAEPVGQDRLHAVDWEAGPTPSTTEPEWPEHVLVVPDYCGHAASLLPALAAHGVLARGVDGRNVRGLDQALRPGGTVLFMRGLDAPADEAVVPELLTLAGHLRERSARLVIVTRGAATLPGERPCPASAALWGAGWSLMAECRDMRTGLLDLDPTSEGASPEALSFMLGEGSPAAVALRGGEALRPRIKPVATPPNVAFSADPEGSYLVVGAFGGIGAALARWLAERGARHLVLAGRSAPEEAHGSLVRALRGLGARVSLVRCDIADAEAVRMLFAGLRGNPPLRGVFHAAGLGLWGPLGRETPAQYRRMAQAKLAGSLNLCQAARGPDLRHFVLCSSIAGVWGARGQVAYAAVNAFQDTLAARRRAEGLPGLAMAWGPWQGGGMAEGEAAAQTLSAAGLRLSTPEWHLARLEQALTAEVLPPALVSVEADWPRLSALHEAVTGAGLFRDLANQPAPAGFAAALSAEIPAQTGIAEQASTRDRLAAIVAAVLRLEPGQLSPRANLVTLGLDSILAMEIVQRLQAETGATLPLRALFETPSLDSLSAHLPEEAAPSTGPGFILSPDPAARHEPFRLTPLQHAYWVGRGPGLALGNIACHAYLEAEREGLDLTLLEECWNRLILRHDTLRLVIDQSGRQRILPEVPRYGVAIQDLREASAAEAQAALDAWRETLSHQVHPAAQWPLFTLRASRLKGKRTRLHLGLDLLIADATSAQILLAELEALMRHGGDAEAAGLAPLHLSFRDYVLAGEDPASGLPAERERARAWWLPRLEDLPPPPRLPLATRPESIDAPVFTRRQTLLPAADWTALKQRIAARGLTPSSFLLAVFAEVTGRWSAAQHFTLSLTLFDRRPWHPEIAALTGDFTAVTLLPVDQRGEAPFAAAAAALHAGMLEVLENRAFDATDVLRALNRERGEEERTGMPVVFTSQFGAAGGRAGLLADPVYAITQTPQVWLDHQVMEVEGALCCNWDAVEALFPSGVLDAMAAAHAALLQRLLAGEQAWDLPAGDMLPAPQHAIRARVNDTAAPLPELCLHDLFLASAARTPEAVALIAADGRSWSYAALRDAALALAARLTAEAPLQGRRVAVLMEKRPEQALAVLAIVMRGGVYVPLDPEQPAARLEAILESAGIDLAVVAGSLPEELAALFARRGIVTVETDLEAAPSDASSAIVSVDPRGPAYLLYTSGSTGTPKGVLLDHRGPVNTVLDINARFGVTARDRVLALSQLGFDLSVYDLFGAFAAGAAMVFPAAASRRDPAHWAALLRDQSVTVWNSVPALFDMLVTEGDAAALAGLRLVLLSGDWVPLPLPRRFRAAGGAARLIAMGGATEASIWSNWFEVDEVPAHWSSIPYGYPLANQRYHVLDAALRHRPDWVEGDLHIAGEGLALRYEGDPERTTASFYPHPVTGERLYRTGDMARYWPDGTLEFLGRRDMQVKIGGHRIELGEIEAALAAHPAVRKAVVDAVAGDEADKTNRTRRLQAWVVLEDEGDDPVHPVRRAICLPEEEASTRREVAQEAVLAQLASAPGTGDAVGFQAFLTDVARQAARDSLLALGLPGNAGARLAQRGLPARLGVDGAMEPVLRDWLALLAEAGDLDTGQMEAGADDGLSVLRDLGGGDWDRLEAGAARFGLASAPLRRLRDDAARRAAVLRGEAEPLSLFFTPGDAALSPEALTRGSPSGPTMVAVLQAVLAAMAARPAGSSLRILQLEARSGLTSLDLVRALPETGWELIVADASPAFLQEARATLADGGFAGHSCVRFQALDPQRPLGPQGIAPGSQDALVLFNALHRTRDMVPLLAHLREGLAPGGLLLAPEMTADNDLQRVTIALLGDGPEQVLDRRRESGAWQADPWLWTEALLQAGFAWAEAVLPPGAPDAFALLLAGQPATLWQADPAALRAFAATRLPAYMVPQGVMLLPELPLSPTGKLDRRRLPRPPRATVAAAELSVLEARIAGIWEEVLGVPVTAPSQSFFTLGGDSLSAVRVVEALRRATGLAVQVRDLFERPMLSAFAAPLEGREMLAEGETGPVLVPAPDAAHEPFPLTDVQEAYWIGRQEGFELGGVSSHLYTEIEVENLPLERIEAAFRKLIARHPMMRAVVDEDGRQRVLPAVPDYVVALRECTADGMAAETAAIREAMSHQVRRAKSWPLFEVRALRRADGRLRLFVSLDNMLFDGRSMAMLIGEWGILAHAGDSNSPLPPVDCTFRDVVLALRETEGSPGWRRALDYWLARLETLPAAPDLPAKPGHAGHAGPPRFRRRAAVLPAPGWQALRERARREGLTANAVLLAAYGEVLRAWSRTASFTINLTLFQRPPLHPAIDRVVGDFTSLILLECDGAPVPDLLARARQVQRQVAEDLAHADVAAVRVLREVARRTGRARGVVCPIVFTSALGAAGGEAGDGENPSLGKLGWGITQTPQVWLDHQAREHEGALTWNWDAVEALFEPGVLDGMVALYDRLLNLLAGDEAAWTRPLPELLAEAGLSHAVRHDRAALLLPPRREVAPKPALVAREAGAPDRFEVLVLEGLAQETGLPAMRDVSFFEQGATSLSLIRLCQGLRAELGVALPVVDLFEHATPAALAAHLRRLAGMGATPLPAAKQPAAITGRRDPRAARRAAARQYARSI